MKWIKLYSRLLLRYLQYFFRARTRYGLHAPFVFQFTEAVIEDERLFYAFQDIESMRRGLLKNRQRITIQDHGAGSLVNPASQRSIKNIARYSAISAASGQLLFRLTLLMKPKTLLELGTSLGISTAYQASAAQEAQMISIEGCPETAAVARQNFKRLGLQNIQIKQGTFAEQLPGALRQLGQLDYLYIDGDHRRGASLSYFATCLPYLHAGSVVVMADIHWSDEMESAWLELQQQECVRLSIDLFHFGLLLFRTEQKVKRHYTIIEAKYKPWRMGFFSSSN